MGAPLVLRFATDATQAQRGVQTLARDVASNMSVVSTAVSLASGASVVSLVQLRAAWALTGVAVSAAIIGITTQLEQFTSIIQKAKEADVSTTFFQAFIKSADEAKVKTEVLETALTSVRSKLIDRLDKPSKAGPLLDGLLLASPLVGPEGSSAPSDFRAAGDNEEKRVRALITAIQDLNNAYQATGNEASKLAALEVAELFGTEFADQIRRGTLNIDDFAENLDRLSQNGVKDGALIAPQELEKLKELGERLDAAGRLVRDAVAPAFRDLASAFVDLSSFGVATLETLASLVKKLGDLYQGAKLVVSFLSSLPGRVGQDISNIFAPNRPNIPAPNIQFDALGNVVSSDGSEPPSSRNSPSDEAFKDFFRRPPPLPPIPIPQAAPDDRPPAPKVRAETPDTTRQDQIERYIQSLEKEVRVIETEAASLGLSNIEKEKANALAKIGSEEVTPKQISQIEALAEKHARLKQSIEDARLAQQAYNDAVRLAGSAVSGFLSDIVSGGQNAEQALSNLIKRLADAVLQAQLLGEGPLAGILGTKAKDGALGGLLGQIFNDFSPKSTGVGALSSNFAAAPLTSAAFGFANGGIMSSSGPLPLRAYARGGVARSPQLALFGEGSGNEAFVPLPDGRSIPVTISAPSLAPVTRSEFSVIINNNGADVAARPQSDGGLVIDIDAMMAQHLSNPSSRSLRALKGVSNLRTEGSLR